MPEAFIGLGSNLGPRRRHLTSALTALATLGAVTRVSPLYETEPVGFAAQGPFLNAAAALDTALSPEALLAALLAIEAAHGRVRLQPNGPRTLDLDILLYNTTILDQPGLQLPHPRLHLRRFVLAPLAAIAPGLVHPVLRQPIQTLLLELTVPAAVTLLEPYPEWVELHPSE